MSDHAIGDTDADLRNRAIAQAKVPRYRWDMEELSKVRVCVIYENSTRLAITPEADYANKIVKALNDADELAKPDDLTAWLTSQRYAERR
jgi:hypothetical protein